MKTPWVGGRLNTPPRFGGKMKIPGGRRVGLDGVITGWGGDYQR